MPPPGGTGGTGGFGFIKEKPDPWEVTSDVIFMLLIPFPTDYTRLLMLSNSSIILKFYRFLLFEIE